ncbi:MAG TPA: oligosaccharide flippase family protein, partial [Polyangiaceae bacterium]|nr:oligosaccharide flippase family protein [Polyangiaceae bacterium]
ALANQLSTLGLGQYYISRRSVDAQLAWHATVAHLTLGVVALGALLALGHSLGLWMKAPAIERYLPGLVASALFDRIAYMPERVLAREMRFRVIGTCRTAGELTYTTASVGLAVAGFGAPAIVAGNLARSAMRLATMSACVPRSAWLSPAPLSATVAREMIRFGLPVSVANAAGFAARRVDNAIVSSLFGADIVGAYNLAYNVADVPAVQVGEQIGDVLFPSFAGMDRPRRKAALLRSTGLLALLTFPLAVGLGAVAPTLAAALLPRAWRDIGPMVAVLSMLSVARPVGWTIAAYLLAQGRPRVEAALELLKLAAVIVLLLTIGARGPLWACAAVGLGFAAHALASMVVVELLDGVKTSSMLRACAAPLVACIPLVLAVLATRRLLSATDAPRGVNLLLEIVAGASAYLATAPLVARPATRDAFALSRLARSAKYRT